MTIEHTIILEGHMQCFVVVGPRCMTQSIVDTIPIHVLREAAGFSVGAKTGGGHPTSRCRCTTTGPEKSISALNLYFPGAISSLLQSCTC